MPLPIDALRPHGRNPRRISASQLALLCDSIKRDPEFMRLRPIVYDADGAILGGNQRWKACKALASFPNDFKLAGGFRERWARIGNSVPPNLMRSIAEHVRKTILESAG